MNMNLKYKKMKIYLKEIIQV